MSVIAEDFLDVAKNLIAASSSEINNRNSTSRAYYAAFHLAQRVAHLCPDNSQLKMGSHQLLSDRFSLHPARAAKGISYILQAMKRYRNSADYEIHDAFDIHISTNMIAQFESLSEKVAQFEVENSPKSA